ncbi:Hypothetical_protein [Hexamita inflata]|uniref:Hypothetical_protein n=1 Tax=Hexamita inflata TaxID=28002 RepID=A0ABP1HSC5_9EUKA
MPRDRPSSTRFRDGRLWQWHAGPRGIGETSSKSLRESRTIFRCFRLARPLDFSNESQTCLWIQTRDIQPGSTTIDEYIGTICLAATLRKKSHLSFHRKSSLKLFCCRPPSGRAHSLPPTRFRRLFLGPLELRANYLSAESPLTETKTRGSTALARRKHCVLSLSFLTSGGAAASSFCGRRSSSSMEKWSEKALFSIAQTYLYFHLKWKTNNNAQRSAQFDSLSGRTSLAVARRTPRYRRNEFQVYFANLEQYFGVFVWLGRWISRTKAKLVYGYKREISSPALPRLMNISALSVQLPRLERNLTCLFIGSRL